VISNEQDTGHGVFPGTWETFAPVVTAVVDVVRPKTIVAVGNDLGPLADQLRKWAATNAAALIVSPVHDVEPFAGDQGDVYLWSGESNYRAVIGALRALEHRVGSTRSPVVVVRHTGWPAGRRDHYAAPEAGDTEPLHASTTRFGVRPGSREPVAGGVPAGAGSAWAIREGGPENGVRTAIEDFVAASNRYEVRFVPAPPGVGVLFERDAVHADALHACLRRWSDDGVLAATEQWQLELLDRALVLEARLGKGGDAGPRLQGENERLRRRVAELERALSEVHRAATELSFSAVLRLIDRAERPARARRSGTTFRSRLIAMRDLASESLTRRMTDG
jgi:hypothetical protein